MDSQQNRRERILEAARHLALRQGLKGVTMEAIAREARIAKPTLYGHFANKEAVFVGVMEALIIDMTSAFESALSADGDLVDRVGASLTGKHGAALRLLEGSPHAAELYSAHDRVAGPQFRALESHVEQRLVGLLSGAGVRDPLIAARIVMAAAQGIAMNARSMTELQTGIDLITRRFLAPELPGKA